MAVKAKGKASKAKAKAKKKSPVVHGIDAMVEAIHADIQSDENVAASAKEVTKVAIKAILNSEKALITGAVADGDRVTYIGFGTFEKRDRAARKGRNPQTGDELEIPAATVPAFSAGKAFKEAVKSGE